MSQSNHDRRLSGYGINLFRNKKTAKIAGNMFNYGPQNSNRVKEAEKRMQSVMGRVAAMESYVTSRAYRLNKEIDNM